jgi:hypothetical protein
MGRISPIAAPATTPRPPTRARRDARHRVGAAVLAIGALLVAGLAWLAISGLVARSALSAARSDVTVLRNQASSGNVTGARGTADSLQRHVARAHRFTTGPVWALAAHLPGGGSIRAVATMTDALYDITDAAVPDLLDVAGRLDPKTVRRADGSMDLPRVSAAVPAVHRAAVIVAAARDRVTAVGHTGIGPIDSARAELLAQLDSAEGTLNSADAAATVLPDMLGANGPRSYLIALQNTAEARGTGGLAGAFGVLDVRNGTMHFGDFDSDRVLRGIPANVEFGKDYDALYKDAATTTKYVNANLSAHFPYGAAIWADMWAKHTGKKVDGVIAVDPAVLSYLLAVTGPATLPDGTRVDAGNVVALTESTAYARYTQDTARRKFLVAVAGAAIGSVTAPARDNAGLMRALARAVGERRLLVWSANPTLQQSLERTAIAGVIPDTDAPFAGLSIVNDGGNKLDYYLDRSVVWTRQGCGTDTTVTAAVTLRNNAPAQLPAYVTDRSDTHGPNVKPGDNRLLVSWYASTGAGMQSVTVDGSPATAHAGTERGHPVFTVDLELPRGATRVVVFRLAEPMLSKAPVTVLQQPLVRPLTFRVEDQACR